MKFGVLTGSKFVKSFAVGVALVVAGAGRAEGCAEPKAGSIAIIAGVVIGASADGAFPEFDVEGPVVIEGSLRRHGFVGRITETAVLCGIADANPAQGAGELVAELFTTRIAGDAYRAIRWQIADHATPAGAGDGRAAMELDQRADLLGPQADATAA